MPSILLQSLIADLSQAERQIDDLNADIDLHEQSVEHRKDDAVDAHRSWRYLDEMPRHRQRPDHYRYVRDAWDRFLELDAGVQRAEGALLKLKRRLRHAENEADRLAEAIGAIQRTIEQERREREDAERRSRHRREREKAGSHSYSSRDPHRGEPSRSRSQRHAEPRSHHRPRYEERRPSIPVEPRSHHRPRYEERRPSIPVEPRTYYYSSQHHDPPPRPQRRERRPSIPIEPRTYYSQPNHYEEPEPRPRYEERRPSYAQPPPPCPSPPPPRASPSARRDQPRSHYHSTHNHTHSTKSKPNRSEQPRSPPPSTRPTTQDPSPATYKTWYAATLSAFNTLSSSQTNPLPPFPYPPPLPSTSPLHKPSSSCTTTSIITTRDPTRKNPACDCAIEAAFTAVLDDINGGIKKEMRHWHPDKFGRIADVEVREEWQKAAGEVFVVLGEMVARGRK